MTAALDTLSEMVAAPRTDPVYNCHSYLTKVPIKAITPFIEAFTSPGQVVADFFAGSGMTGLAAWTLGRQAHLSDISVLGHHIAQGYLVEVSDSDLSDAGASVSNTARTAMGDLYGTVRASDGVLVDFVRTVWSGAYACPSCGHELIYFELVTAGDLSDTHCPACQKPFSKRSWIRSQNIPVQVVVRDQRRRLVEQEVTTEDQERIANAIVDLRLSQVPSQPIERHREMYHRSSLAKSGLTETKKFFSARNAIALLELWQAINIVEDAAIREKLRFCFTAILPRASMRYQWSRKRPLNAQNQTYYVAPIYYEWNVFELFSRKVRAAQKAHAYLRENATWIEAAEQPAVTYDITPAGNLEHLADASIDYIFTDPPFGSNIFYSDMTLFHEAWLGQITDWTAEAVVYTTGEQKVGAEERYERLLREAFQEGWRILKPGAYMSVVFGNSSGRVWGFLQRALREIGFEPAPMHVAILDKRQRSVKGLNSGTEGVVTVDLIVTVRKPNIGFQAPLPTVTVEGRVEELIADAIRETTTASDHSPSHVYARILKRAIEEDLTLDGFHLVDVLSAMRRAGWTIDEKSGLLVHG